MATIRRGLLLRLLIAMPDNDDLPTILGAPQPGDDDAASGSALRAGTRVQEFEIEGLVGEGGFSIVYRARDTLLGRTIALKEYMPAALAQRTGARQVQARTARQRETFELGLRSFINEARLLASFEHAALVKVYRFWEENGTAYLVMPLYHGRTLREWLAYDRNRISAEATLLAMLHPLLDALELMHGHQCYHRDIAPDNILLLDDDDGSGVATATSRTAHGHAVRTAHGAAVRGVAGSTLRPVLLDFGAARRVIGDATQALTVILKPGYAPIEQYAEAAHARQGPWTDIYALCATLYNAVTGRVPEPSVSRVIHDALEPASSAGAGRYSTAFLSAIDRGMAVRAEDRVASVQALRALLPALDGGDAPNAAARRRSDDDDESTVILDPKQVAAAFAAAGGAGGALSAGGGILGASRSAGATSDGGTGASAGVSSRAVEATEQSARSVEPTHSAQRTSSRQGSAASADGGGSRSRVPMVAVVIAAVLLAAIVWWAMQPPVVVDVKGTTAGPSSTSGAGSALGVGTSTTTGGSMGNAQSTSQGTSQGATGATTQATQATQATPPGAAAGNTTSPVETTPPAGATATPPATEPFGVLAALQDIAAGADASLTVQATVDEAQLVIGKDRLAFTVESSQSGHVYVFTTGTEHTHLYQLFPNPSDRANRIERGKVLRLPRSDWSLDAFGPPGTNHLLVIVSRSPRDFKDAGLVTRGKSFPEFDLARAAQRWATRSAGATSPLAGRTACAANAPCPEGYGAQLVSVDEVKAKR